MARQDDLDKIEAKYEKRFVKASADLGAAQDALNMLIGEKVEICRRVNTYYDAVDKKAEIDRVLAIGLPVI